MSDNKIKVTDLESNINKQLQLWTADVQEGVCRLVDEKADKLKKLGMWNEVRDTYEELKNLYLRRGDRDHPSFVDYVEAVNQVYQTI